MQVVRYQSVFDAAKGGVDRRTNCLSRKTKLDSTDTSNRTLYYSPSTCFLHELLDAVLVGLAVAVVTSFWLAACINDP